MDAPVPLSVPAEHHLPGESIEAATASMDSYASTRLCLPLTGSF